MWFENEKIVEIKICTKCSTSFDITDKDLEFYEKISPIFGWTKYLIPTPTLCPDCRAQRRFSARNERNLYKRKCDATGKDILSIFSPDKKNIVYSADYWWSDKWNPLDYGKDFDFSRPCFTQFQELMESVPLLNLLWANNENSEYINLTADCKNCYIVMESSNDEDCYYGYWLQQSKNCCDCSFIHQCENSYEIQNCFFCYHLIFSNNSESCSYGGYLNDCKWCKNCFFCVNLVNKEYCILNVQYTKEEYLKITQKLFENLEKNREPFIEQFEKLCSTAIKKYAHVEKIENSTGDYLKETKNCLHCFHSYDAQDCKYGEHVFRNAKEIVDANTIGRDSSLVYESINTAIDTARNSFCMVCWSSHDLLYCFHCFNNGHLFGCVGLTNKEYCIFNKQYTKVEYEKLVPKIIEHMKKTGEWGQFFPSSISAFGYNESDAMNYFPMTPSPTVLLPKTEGSSALHQVYLSPLPLGEVGWGISPLPLENLRWGFFNWSYYESPVTKVEKVIPAEALPEKIADIPDDILNWSIECEFTKRPYRIIQQELEFYRLHKLPIPHFHPDIRHSQRLAKRNPPKLYERKCAKCEVTVVSTYSPEKTDVIYCENCYTSLVI